MVEVGGLRLSINQSAGTEPDSMPTADEKRNRGDTGLVVWPSALMLCRYLEAYHHQHELCLRGTSVLDIGAGTGALGLCCAALGANVVLTDFAIPVLRLLAANTAANTPILAGRCVPPRVVQFDWRKQFPISAAEVTALSSARRSAADGGGAAVAFDYIVASDVLFSPELVDDLAAVLTALSPPRDSPPQKLFLRSTDTFLLSPTS